MTKTAIIILNWNGWEDTTNCLNSLSDTTQEDDYVFIIDNFSTNNSVEKINNYFDKKEINYISSSPIDITNVFSSEIHYYLIQNDRNLGFGAGNNVILKKLNTFNVKFEYTWLLNNDAIVHKDALKSLKHTMSLDKMTGAVGSLILNLPDNGKVQSCGVKYFKFLGVSKLLLKNQNYNFSSVQGQLTNTITPLDFDYLNGASLMLRNRAIEQIGYFDESFFLYSEEFDLQLRLQQSHFSLQIDPNSIVYHKLSGGTSKSKYLFYYYYNMSSVMLSKKHFGVFYTSCLICNLSFITLLRTLPSLTNFKWGMKGIIKGINYTFKKDISIG